MLGSGLGQLRFGICRHHFRITMQPANSRAQHRCVLFPGSQRLNLGFRGAAHFTRKTRHHLVAVSNQRFQRFLVGHWLNGAQLKLGWNFPDGGQAHFFHGADIDPADIKFVRLDRKFGRCGVSVVVVVQLLAANHDAPGRNVGARIGRLKVAVTPVVANAIDDAGRRHGNPGHLNGPHGQPGRTEQRQIKKHHQADTLPAKTRIDIALEPVIGRAVAVAEQGFPVFGLGAVQLGALPEHGLDATRLRTVRVIHGFTLGVVLAVHRHPLLGHLASSQPKPETEEMRRNGVQFHGAMRLMAVQIKRHADNGDVSSHQRVQRDLPPAGCQQPMRQPVEGGIEKNHKSPITRCIRLCSKRSKPLFDGSRQRAFHCSPMTADCSKHKTILAVLRPPGKSRKLRLLPRCGKKTIGLVQMRPQSQVGATAKLFRAFHP